MSCAPIWSPHIFESNNHPPSAILVARSYEYRVGRSGVLLSPLLCGVCMQMHEAIVEIANTRGLRIDSVAGDAIEADLFGDRVWLRFGTEEWIVTFPDILDAQGSALEQRGESLPAVLRLHAEGFQKEAIRAIERLRLYSSLLTAEPMPFTAEEYGQEFDNSDDDSEEVDVSARIEQAKEDIKSLSKYRLTQLRKMSTVGAIAALSGYLNIPNFTPYEARVWLYEINYKLRSGRKIDPNTSDASVSMALSKGYRDGVFLRPYPAVYSVANPSDYHFEVKR